MLLYLEDLDKNLSCVEKYETVDLEWKEEVWESVVK